MTDLMLDQFDHISQKELKVILGKERKTMLVSELCETEESKMPDRDMPLERLRCPVYFLTKLLLRFGSIPGANFLITLWRKESL